MKKLTQEECKDLLNKTSNISKYYLTEIPEISSIPDFYEGLESIDLKKDIEIKDVENRYTKPYRFITRDKEALYIEKSNDKDYEDKIIYYFSPSVNKVVKMIINYNQIISNDYNKENIHLEVLTNYKRRELGDVYIDGEVISSKEEGFKARILAKDNKCFMIYGKYKYERITVKYPSEKYISNKPIPELKDLNTEVLEFDMKDNKNPAIFAYEQINSKKSKQRIIK